MRVRAAVAAAVLLGAAGVARAIFILPPEAPLERLLAQLPQFAVGFGRFHLLEVLGESRFEPAPGVE